MSRGKKTGGRDWRPGESGNLKGRPPMDSDTRALRALTQKQVAEIASLILGGKIEDLIKIAGQKDARGDNWITPPDPNATPLQIWFVRVIQKGIAKGDMLALTMLLDRTIGRVKDHIEIGGPDGGSIPLKTMTDDELKKLIKETLG